MRRHYVICTLLVLFADFCTDGQAVGRDEGAALAVTASAPGGWAALAPALAELAVRQLRAAGMRARAVPPPPACAPPLLADAAACRDAALGELARGRLHVALLTVPAAGSPAARFLRNAGLDELGDLTGPLRRQCFAPPPALSLLDFADARLGSEYRVSTADLSYIQNSILSNDSSTRQQYFTDFTPEWCTAKNASCATIITSTAEEARLLMSVVHEHRLFAAVHPLGAAPIESLESRISNYVLCDWAPDPIHFSKLSILGPPYCNTDDTYRCPFESRRLVKLVNATALARSPEADRALVRLKVTADGMRELKELARRWDPKTAAARYLAAHPTVTKNRQIRVAVFLPYETRREAYDAPALAAAAALAEADLEGQWSGAKFKVEIVDDRCDTTEAYKYLIGALASEYGELSAVAGPACGAPFADVVRQGPVHGLPVLAYSAQAAPAAPAAALALLAAGDARRAASALGALLHALRWRRLAALSEPATRAALAAARLQADLVAHLELPDDKADYDPQIFTQWAARVVSAGARVVYACVEDARALRAALCAGRAAGLLPAAGAVWLLPAGAAPRALRPAPGEPCGAEQLAEVAAGHLSVAPAWLLPWLDDPAANDTETKPRTEQDRAGEETRAAWERRWRRQCALQAGAGGGGGCAGGPGPHAALLYDVLRLWTRALAPLVPHPEALDDLHLPAFVRTLIINATKIEFTGLTGPFEWENVGSDDDKSALYARSSPLVISQWDGRARREVGRWERGALRLREERLRWRTPDGRRPDDGDEQCALRAVADFFHTDCRAAFIILGSSLLSVAVVFLAATAVYCKRRAERKYRSRLEALGLHPLLPKTVGLDRWEIPRERVVINRKLGMGAFGTVYGGHALLEEDRGWTAVAVKTLKAGASTEEKLDFLSEAEAMKRFDHKNIVRLLAVITKTEPVCTVMEFMLYGDLKNYLLARRHLAGAGGCGVEGADDAEEQVSARRLTGMALDAARALSYLAQLRYVHRDVAARNCLVSARRVVKLADFGMTRLVFENDYYRFSRKGMLPVRWMAPESLESGIFSPASDVWSFGVLLYEIVTFGALPFQGLSNSEVLARVKSGHTLELPSGLKPQLEGLMKSCWQADYKARPAASEVAAFLADAPRLLAPCLHVPLDALPLDDAPPAPRWLWAAPASAATDTTYLSAEADPLASALAL